LRDQLHKVILEAYQVENFRATNSLAEMRRFIFLYGISSFFLVVLALAAGTLTLRRILLNDRLQFDRAELLREKKDAAEAANKEKAQFLSSASHDLRQPAHALGMFMERIQQVSDGPLAKDLVANAMAAVHEMQDMLDSMFDLSHLESESAQTKIQAFPINDVFDSVRSVLESAAISKGLRLRIRNSEVWLESDSSLIRRILLNLVSNSIRYTDRGTVLVACRKTRSGTHARIEVWDSGIGIASQDQEKVFQEFYQVGNPQRDRRFGLGVGLSVVDRCCRLLKHPLSLQSRLGAGTKMSLVVPIAKPASKADDSIFSPTLVGDAFTKANVMLIEDDAMGRTALAGLLESWGYSVLAVESANMAAEQFHKLPGLDIIISDLRLGEGVDGIEAIRMLQAKSGKEVSAFLISGDTSSKIQEHVKASGLLLLSKPVRPAKLRSLLRHLPVQVAATLQSE
jgi:signal transduction histidine kinase/CheY-like chemotaxis protein